MNEIGQEWSAPEVVDLGSVSDASADPLGFGNDGIFGEAVGSV